MAARYDIRSEAFDLYLIKQIMKLTQSQLAEIPVSIQFKYKPDMTPDDVRSMSFAQKMYVLSRFCKKKVYVVAEDEEDGLGIEEFVEATNGDENVFIGDGAMAKIYTKGVFVVGGDDTMQSVSGLSNLCRSPVYKYLNGLRTGKITETDYDKTRMAVMSIASFLTNYEHAKDKYDRSRFNGRHKLLLLMHYADGKMKPVSGAYQSRLVPKTIAVKLMSEMTQEKWFVGEGSTRGAMYRLTVLGFHQLHLIMKEILNTAK